MAVVQHERPIARSHQESRLDQRREDRFTRPLVQKPQAPGLLSRQPQPGHLQKLSAYASHHVLQASALVLQQPLVVLLD